MHTLADVSLTFGLLAMSYGAGCQFINMLSRMGLSVHWDTLNDFMSKFKDKATQKLSQLHNQPIIIGHDNINIYQSTQHARYNKDKAKMLNLDAR